MPSALLSMLADSGVSASIVRTERAGVDVTNANVIMQVLDSYDANMTFTP